jgi:hypothetical protein
MDLDTLKELQSELENLRMEQVDLARTMPKYEGTFAAQARAKWKRDNLQPYNESIRQLEKRFVDAIQTSGYSDVFDEYRRLTEVPEW